MVNIRQRERAGGGVNDLVRSLLDQNYTRTAERVLNAVASSVNSGLIQQRLNEFELESRRLDEAGERLSRDNAILRALLADLDDTMRANERLVDGVVGDVTRTGVDAAETLQRQLALPGITDAQLRLANITWNKPPPEAVNALVNYVEGDAWQTLLREQYANNVVDIISNQAIRGIAEGWNPLRIAREVRKTTTALPAYQANNLLRTAQLTSYRDGTALTQNANVGIIDQVVRISARDQRVCLACIAQSGDIIWDRERNGGTPISRINDHHQGRCTSVIIVRGRARTITTGLDWFASLPEDRQRLQSGFSASPAKWRAYQAGAVQLRDFVQEYRDPIFGEMVREASLQGVLGDDAKQYYGRRE